MTDSKDDGIAEPFRELAPLHDAPVAPAHAIASIALTMALKFHDINTVQDGVLYQQYKMEGKNLHGLHLDHVFETAMKMEAFLLGSSQRIAALVVDAINMPDPDDEPHEDEIEPEAKPEQPESHHE